MEEEKIVEQPIEEQAKVTNDNIESADSEIGSTEKKEQDGKFGKFSSSSDLLDAYENLHKEFTRKCQRLSEIEKEKTQENNPSIEKLEEGLSKFLSKNDEAKNYSQEILQKVSAKEEGNSFENAWAKVVLEKIASRDAEKKDDPLVKKFVFEDENLRNSVIEIYMKELQSKKPPILLKSNSGERATRVEPVAPTSLKEAKRLMEDMFS